VHYNASASAFEYHRVIDSISDTLRIMAITEYKGIYIVH